jgi:hypothetical protein
MTTLNADETYIVAFREEAWWILWEENRAGPYASEREASEAAIRAAEAKKREGGGGRVWVDVPGDGMPEIFDTRSG